MEKEAAVSRDFILFDSDPWRKMRQFQEIAGPLCVLATCFGDFQAFGDGF